MGKLKSVVLKWGGTVASLALVIMSLTIIEVVSLSATLASNRGQMLHWGQLFVQMFGYKPCLIEIGRAHV